jgi:hypothetical protein
LCEFSSSFSDDEENEEEQMTQKTDFSHREKEEKKKKKHKKHTHRKKEKKSKRKDVVKYEEGKLDTRKPANVWLTESYTSFLLFPLFILYSFDCSVSLSRMMIKNRF